MVLTRSLEKASLGQFFYDFLFCVFWGGTGTGGTGTGRTGYRNRTVGTGTGLIRNRTEPNRTVGFLIFGLDYQTCSDCSPFVAVQTTPFDAQALKRFDVVLTPLPPLLHPRAPTAHLRLYWTD